MSDKYIVEDRIHPREMMEETEEIRKKMEKINQEYINQQSKKK